MIDLHSHLLPGIDDGPRNWDESIALCRRIADHGITLSIATPHLIDGVYNNTQSRLRALVRELNQRLLDHEIALDVRIGAEVDFSSRHVLEVTDELPRIGDGGAVLLEMPVAVVPPHIAETLFRIRARGLIPLIAHPERNEELQRRPELAREWIAAGAALQLDAESLLGLWGQRAKACAETLLLGDCYHAMASDAHSADRRPPRLREALKYAETLVHGDPFRLVTDGPVALLAGHLPDLALRPRAGIRKLISAQSHPSFFRRFANRWGNSRR